MTSDKFLSYVSNPKTFFHSWECDRKDKPEQVQPCTGCQVQAALIVTLTKSKFVLDENGAPPFCLPPCIFSELDFMVMKSHWGPIPPALAMSGGEAYSFSESLPSLLSMALLARKY